MTDPSQIGRKPRPAPDHVPPHDDFDALVRLAFAPLSPAERVLLAKLAGRAM